MGALFVIRRGGVAELFHGKHMEELALPVLARGPDYATTCVTDLPRTKDTAFGAAGFLIDHDARRAVVLDLGVCFDADDARVNGWTLGTASRVPALGQLDLTDEEAQLLVAVMREGVTWDAWIDALKRAPLADSWRDWTLASATRESFTREVAAAAGAAPRAIETGASYFPAGVFHDVPRVDDFKRGWYSGLLRSAGEPVLFSGVAPGTSIVRLLVVPALAPERVCRMTTRGDAVTLDVFSEPAPSPLVSKKPSARLVPRKLRASTGRELLAVLERAEFWTLPTNEPPRGHDGEQWVIEAAIDGRYHVVDRWCPESGGFWELGRWLERFGGWKLPR